MRKLINYIRSCFCDHEYELIYETKVECDSGTTYRVKTYRCRKCGFVQRVKNY